MSDIGQDSKTRQRASNAECGDDHLGVPVSSPALMLWFVRHRWNPDTGRWEPVCDEVPKRSFAGE